jgi:trans-2,3-dihydro-3-hydroxyanthranilate isomerase
MRRELGWYDVFTTVPFEGNPLGVVLDATGLDDQTMAAIAAELGLSETTFVLPPGSPGVDHDVRIFTPTRELAFAGHPTIGTAVALAERAGTPSTTLVLGLGAGPTAVTVELGPGGALVAAFAAPRRPRVGPVDAQADDVAGAIGLRASDLDPTVPLHVADAGGTAFVVVGVPDLDVLARAHPVATVGDVVGTYVVAPDGGGFRARMFAPGAGVPEDPATGSAACAFAGSLATYYGDFAAAGRYEVAVTQGVEMGRRSELALSFDVADGDVTEVRLSGAAVPVLSGTIEA